MGLFSTIMDKLGFGAEPAQAATPPPATAPNAPSSPAAATAPRPAAMSAVDVVGKLEGLAAKNPQQLNWKNSTVDLMKLLGLDSSHNARKELATELGCPADKLNDSAQMNTWLHKTVLKKLSENGGNIPKELLN
jgi:3-oxoacyl-ACP reductase-like protein